MERISNSIPCRKCGANEHIPRYAQRDFFICKKCSQPIGYRCSGCEEFFENADNLYYDGSIYRCKICNTIQWGYSDWKLQ